MVNEEVLRIRSGVKLDQLLYNPPELFWIRDLDYIRLIRKVSWATSPQLPPNSPGS